MVEEGNSKKFGHICSGTSPPISEHGLTEKEVFDLNKSPCLSPCSLDHWDFGGPHREDEWHAEVEGTFPYFLNEGSSRTTEENNRKPNDSSDNVHSNDNVDSKEGQKISIDVGEHFVTEDVFETRDKLVEWAKEIGRKLNFVILIGKSQNRIGGKKPKLHLKCERSGEYRSHMKKDLVPKTNPPPEKKRKTSTKKCNCPFYLKGIPGDGDTWKVEVVSGIHNHELAVSLLGHAYANRLSCKEQDLVDKLLKIGTKPRDILSQVRATFNDNTSTMKTIYNAKAKIRSLNQEGRSPMQQLMKLLVESNYVYHFSKNEETDEVTNLFWAHPDSINIFKCFHTVLMLDCTYKTNRFKKPLLQIVGITSTMKTFTAALVFMDGEVTNQYAWALNRLRTLFPPDSMPKVFVTDRELALINAIGEVFPHANRLLCTWHIDKCVVAKVKGNFKHRGFKNFMSMFRMIMYAETVSDYNQAVEEFVRTWSRSNLNDVTYVQKTWLILKDTFVTAWTNQVMHMGNNTTNRVEGAHAKLKKHLGNSEGNYVTCWESIHAMNEIAIREIKASFEYSRTKVKGPHQSKFMRDLRGYVSHAALDLMVDEIHRADGITINVKNCGCVLRSVYGLPCAHEMIDLMKQQKVFPLDIIHHQWTQLSINPIPEEYNDLDSSHEMELLHMLWGRSTGPERKAILERLRDVVSPLTTNLSEPLQKTITKGAPKKNKMSKKEKEAAKSTKRNLSAFEYAKCIDEDLPSPPIVRTRNTRATRGSGDCYLDQMPVIIYPFINAINDVPGDGHCGYHAVAQGLGFPLSTGWKEIRKIVLEDLNNHKDFWEEMFNDDYYSTLAATNNFDPGVDRDWYYSHPYTNYVVSTHYNCVLVHLTLAGSTTFLPLRNGPPVSQSGNLSQNYEMICIGYVNDCHFVSIKLGRNTILPPLALQWQRYATNEARGWFDLVGDRIDNEGAFYPPCSESNEPSEFVVNLDD